MATNFFRLISQRPLLLTFLLSAILLTAINGADKAATATASGDWDLDYHYETGTPFTIPQIRDNLSGLTYHPDSDTLFAILNNPETIIELSKQGQIKRQIPLKGFVDTESLDYLGNDLFVVTEERRRRLVFFYIDSDTKTIEYTDSQVLPLDRASDENRGFEGVAWSPRHGFFIAQEEPPRIMHHMMHDAKSAINASRLNQSLPLEVSDYAGISILQAGEEFLLILSEASHNLHVLNLQGEPVSRLSLRSGFMRLWPLMEQPEGVTVDNDGNIYLVGEPNQMLVLKRKTRLAQIPAAPHS